jgi:hypothetical protein
MQTVFWAPLILIGMESLVGSQQLSPDPSNVVPFLGYGGRLSK